VISLAYVKATDTLDRAPESLQDIMPYLKELEADPNTILISPDDGEPYVIIWGVDYRAPGNQPVIAYEKTGKDGKRYVCQINLVVHLNEAEFKKAPFPPGRGPAY
jgi:hypothetical protein